MYTLVIVESPAKCKKIEEFLGSASYKCVASFGHMRELPHIKNIAVDDGSFKPTYQNADSKKKQIATIRRLATATECCEVILATDQDREGEAIAWHLCQLLGLNVATTKRIVFSEITRDALQNAVSNPRTISMPLVRAQQARQILDILVGFTISPHLWNVFSSKASAGEGTSLSAGRCQTPALRIIYDNYLKQGRQGKQESNDNDDAAVRYRITGLFTEHAIPFVYNVDLTAEQTETFLEKNIRFAHQLTIPESPETATRSAPPPLTTTILLQAASNELHLSPTATMRYAQTLYEQGRITYMRTEGQTFSREFLESIHRIYRNDERFGLYLTPLLPPNAATTATTSNNGEEVHEPIRPVDITFMPSELDEGNEKRLYSLIWRRSLEACMLDAQIRILRAFVSAPYIPSLPMTNAFKYVCEDVAFLGWKSVRHYLFNHETDADDDDDGNKGDDDEKQKGKGKLDKTVVFRYLLLQHYKNTGIPVSYLNFYSTAIMTSETNRHLTEARLVKLLKDKGIGRPSTYADIVNKIQLRQYVRKQDVQGVEMNVFEFSLHAGKNRGVISKPARKIFGAEKNKLVIQPLGCMVARFCVKFWPTLFAYDYTNEMERQLDEIATNTVSDWRALCRSCMSNMTLSSAETAQLAVLVKLDIPLMASGGDNNISEWKLIRGTHGPVIIEVVANKKEDDVKPRFISPRDDLCLEDVAERHAQGQVVRLEDVANMDQINEIATAASETTDKCDNYGSRIIRFVSKDLSIRSGRRQGWNDYAFYQTPKMKAPRFVPLGGFCDDYKTCSDAALIEYVKNYVPPRRYKKK